MFIDTEVINIIQIYLKVLLFLSAFVILCFLN